MKYLTHFKQLSDMDNFIKIFHNCIYHTAIDEFEYTCLYTVSPKLQKLNKNGTKVYDEFETILQDLFYALYKIEPKFIEEHQVDQSAIYFNRIIITQIMEVAKFKELRIYTTSNELNTAIGVLELGEKIIELLQEQLEKFQKEKEKFQNLMDNIKEMMKDQYPKTDEDIPEDVKNLIDELIEQMKKSIQDLDLDLGDIASIMEDLTKVAEDNNKIMNRWGLSQNDNFKKLPYKEKIRLFDKLRNNKKLQEIIDMVGKFKTVINLQQSTQININSSSLNKVTTSNEITKAVPSELLKLLDPDFELLLFNDMLNYSLQSYEYKNDEEKNRGPIVICIDESGSMSGNKEIWSKAMALSIVQQASSENRGVFVIHFSNVTKQSNMHVNYFPPNASLDFEQVIDMAQHFYGHGTSFEQPLKKAIECIDTNPEFTNSDILFITDGECNITDKFLNELNTWKIEKNVQIISIQIKMHGHMDSKTLYNFSNFVYSIKELTDTLFTEVNKKLFS